MVKDTPSAMAATQVMVVFLILAVVALVVDRRAILVSSLAYLAYAAGTLIQAAGAQSSSLAISTLAVGAVVLDAFRRLTAAAADLHSASCRSAPPAPARRWPHRPCHFGGRFLPDGFGPAEADGDAPAAARSVHEQQ